MLTPSYLGLGLLLALLGVQLVAGSAAIAEEAEVASAPLFINLISDDPHRSHMALSFGQKQLVRGHPLTLFLNDRGVLIGAKQGVQRFGKHQEIIAELLDAGAKVIACPMCMQHYGVAEADLLDGVQVGKPELTGGALFAPDTRTLTW
jgi:predicted peroxiredoxin